MVLSLSCHRSFGGIFVDVRLSEKRDMAVAWAFFRSAKAVTGVTPARVTTDGHDSYPRAIRTELDAGVKHRTNQYLNNRIEQDHRGFKGRYGPMRGFKSHESASRFCRCFDELRNHLQARSRRSRNLPTNARRHRFQSVGSSRSAFWKRPDHRQCRFTRPTSMARSRAGNGASCIWRSMPPAA